MKEFEEFLKVKSRDKSSATIRSYRIQIQKFVDYFNLQTSDDVEKLQSNDYLSYQTYLLDSGLSPSSCNGNFKCVSSFVNWLKKYHYIKHIPEINEVERLAEKKKAIFYLTPDEVSSMIKKTKNLQKKMMLLLMFTTGVRRGELANIKISDIVDGELMLTRKENKEQKLKLTPEFLELYNKYLSKRKVQSQYLFSNSYGKHISPDTVNRRVKSSAKRANIPFDRLKKVSAHVTRKTCASQLLNSGVSISVVQKILGHASVTTTEKYYAEVYDKSIQNALLSQKPIMEKR